MFRCWPDVTYAPITVSLPQSDIHRKQASSYSGKDRILVVDDEVAVASMIKMMLERIGYRVTALTEGSEALQLFCKNSDGFDLLITDQVMRDMTGCALAKEVLAVRKDMPVILCTGYSGTLSPDKAKEAGIREFVMKPFTKKEMAEAIHRALGTEDSG